jgi:pimeloyl-ACP methyl ester carboxylesterase
VPYDVAVATARAAIASTNFPEHFKRTRVLRFEGGEPISPEVPIRIVWGDRDRVALARKSRFIDELPEHATVETWSLCGHMMMWDRQAATVEAALACTAPSPTPSNISSKVARVTDAGPERGGGSA